MRQRISPPPTVIISNGLSKLTSWGGLADIPDLNMHQAREYSKWTIVFLIEGQHSHSGSRQWFRWAMGRIPYLRLSPG